MEQAVSVPGRVVLRGIEFRVRVHDNCVIFTESTRCGPCYASIIFERKTGCWYVTINSSSESVMVTHIEAAYERVKAWFGGNHSFTKDENSL